MHATLHLLQADLVDRNARLENKTTWSDKINDRIRWFVS